MTRQLLASVLAIALGLGAIAPGPAVAGRDNNDVGRLIAGAITLYIFGKAIEQASRRPAHRAGVPVSQAPRRPGVIVPPVAPPRPVFRGRVPNECRFTVANQPGHRGRIGVYSKPCLDEVMYRPERLPAQCLRRVRVRHGGVAEVYGETCLGTFGFRDSNWQG